MRTFRVNGAVFTSSMELLLKPFVAYPRELDPSFDLWQNVGVSVFTRPLSQVQN